MQSRKLTKPSGLCILGNSKSKIFPPKVITWHFQATQILHHFFGAKSPHRKTHFYRIKTSSLGTYSVVAARWSLWTRPIHVPWRPGGPKWYDWRTFFSIVSCWLLPLTNWFIACWCSATCSSNPLLARWTMDGCGAAELPRDTEKPGHTRLGMSDDTQVLTGGREKTLWPLLAPE